MDPQLINPPTRQGSGAPRQRELTVWQSRSIWILIAIVVGYTVIVIRLSVYGPSMPDAQFAGTPVEIDQRVDQCIKNVLQAISKDHPELWLYRDVSNDCVLTIYNVDSLVDFDIRREKLLRKELDERVLLWMVVAVTMSGVAFAGLQIWLSYNLAISGLGDFGEATEMTLKKGDLALRSSVTGLFILAFSLAFFVSYVKWIYTDQEVVIAHPENVPLPSGHIEGTGSITPSATGQPPVIGGQPTDDNPRAPTSAPAVKPGMIAPEHGIGQKPPSPTGASRSKH